jgi:hypothetical protein
MFKRFLDTIKSGNKIGINMPILIRNKPLKAYKIVNLYEYSIEPNKSYMGSYVIGLGNMKECLNLYFQ